MNAYEPVGYLASLLVLATFCMRDMLSLRVVAIASNIAFISYGALAEISPVLLLHVVLLPVNMLRLSESVRSALRRCAEAKNCATGRSGRMSLKRRRRRVPQVVEYSTNSGKLGSATANSGASTDLLHAKRT